MLLIKIALVVLIGWTIFERWVWPKIKKPETSEPRGLRSKVIYIDACHAESAYKQDQDDEDAARRYNPFRITSEAKRRAENRRRFLQELEDFCLDEGLDLKVWEDLEFDALGMQLHDRKTSRALQARVKIEDYESAPILCANRIKRAWEGGK